MKVHDNTPCIFIVLDQEEGGHEKDDMIVCMRKLKEKANILPIIITDVKDRPSREFFDSYADKRVFTVPRSGYLSALLCVMPLQRLAYDITVARGFDPDRPRNLAKELTTK